MKDHQLLRICIVTFGQNIPPFPSFSFPTLQSNHEYTPFIFKIFLCFILNGIKCTQLAIVGFMNMKMKIICVMKMFAYKL